MQFLAVMNVKLERSLSFGMENTEIYVGKKASFCCETAHIYVFRQGVTK